MNGTCVQVMYVHAMLHLNRAGSIPTTIYPPYPLTLLLPIALLKDDVMHMLHLNPTTATEHIPQLSHPQLNPHYHHVTLTPLLPSLATSAPSRAGTWC